MRTMRYVKFALILSLAAYVYASVWFSEGFEGTGYETAGWQESVSSCTIDPVYDTQYVTNAPASWEDQCWRMQAVPTGGAGYAYNWDEGPEGVTYLRFDFIYHSEQLADNQENTLFATYDESMQKLYEIKVRQISGTVKLRIYSYHDGSSNSYDCFGQVAMDTRYTVQVRWDATADEWEWIKGGVVQPNNVDASSPVTSPGTLTSTHSTVLDHIYIGGVHDNVAEYFIDQIDFEDSDWIEPPSEGGWAHEVNTIGAANIAKINGIAIGNIAKINKVE